MTMTARPDAQSLDGAYLHHAPVFVPNTPPPPPATWSHAYHAHYEYPHPPPQVPVPPLPVPPPEPEQPEDVDLSTLNLWSLQDGEPGKKPPYPYPTIILCALKGSPKGRLTLEEMYKAIEDRFPFYATYKPYRNSVRHNLSLNSMFVKVPRPITDPGKGCYWTIKKGAEIGVPAGTKRERKRNKKAASSLATVTGPAATSAHASLSPSPSSAPVPVSVPVPVALPPRSQEDEYPDEGRQRHFRYIRVEDRATPVQGATAYGGAVYSGGPQRPVRRRKSPPVAPYPTPYASSSHGSDDPGSGPGTLMLEEYEPRAFDESFPMSPAPPHERYTPPVDEQYPSDRFAPVHLPPESPSQQYAPPPQMTPHYAPPPPLPERVSPPQQYAALSPTRGERYGPAPQSPSHHYAPVSPTQHYAHPPAHTEPQRYPPPPHQYEQPSPTRQYEQVSAPQRFEQQPSPPQQYAPPLQHSSPPPASPPLTSPPSPVAPAVSSTPRPPAPPPIPPLGIVPAPLPTFGAPSLPAPFTPGWSFSNPTGTRLTKQPDWSWKPTS